METALIFAATYAGSMMRCIEEGEIAKCIYTYAYMHFLIFPFKSEGFSDGLFYLPFSAHFKCQKSNVNVKNSNIASWTISIFEL